jgi:hypothetical protein
MAGGAMRDKAANAAGKKLQSEFRAKFRGHHI